ncbi:Chaperone protein DnaJ, partial [Linum perenne]
MECNKEEAIRTKSLAEAKLQNKDFKGARKMAMEAQQLYKELDKIGHILAICNVHCVVESKIHGTERDWYGILQIEETDDEATIKTHYRKLALLLHLDKNKLADAEAAFKLIGEAQTVLLDIGKRTTYDMKCKSSVTKLAEGPSNSSKFGAQNGFRGSVDGKNRSDDEESKTPQKKAKGNGSTEWKCLDPEFNVKCPDPEFNVKCPDPEFNDFEKKWDVNLFQVENIWAIYDSFDCMPRFYAQIKRVFPPGKFKITWLEADPNTGDEEEWVYVGLPVSCGMFKLGNSVDADNFNLFSHRAEWEKVNHSDAYRIVPRNGQIWALFKNWDINWKSWTDLSNRKLDYDFVEIMSDFSDYKGLSVLYLEKVKGFVSLFCRISNDLVQIKPTVPSFTMTGKERDGVPEGSFELDPAALPEPEFATTHDDPPPEANGTHAESNDPETDHETGPAESDDLETEQVMGQEFFDFNAQKSIEMFERGQIWSLYCDEDSLPKYYAQNPKTNGRRKTCEYNIFPLEGEVWAMYRDWAPTLKRSGLKSCNYDVVKVLEKNDQHLKVSHLEHVKGHNSVFRASAKHQSSTVDMSELLRFSHQIPAFRLREYHGRLVLDSAALQACCFTK